MCKYCAGKEPLTDKVHEDGSKFDDRLSTKIEFFGSVPVLTSEYKAENFNWPFCNMLSQEQKKFLAKKWAVEIKFCPCCGKKLY